MNQSTKLALRILKFYIVLVLAILGFVGYRNWKFHKELEELKQKALWEQAQETDTSSDSGQEQLADGKQLNADNQKDDDSSKNVDLEKDEAKIEPFDNPKEETTNLQDASKTLDGFETVVLEGDQGLTESKQKITSVLTNQALTQADNPDTDGYFRRVLSEDMCQDYDAIYYAIVNHERKKLNTKDSEVVRLLQTFVDYDHPELYEANGLTIYTQELNKKIKSIQVEGRYTMTEQERDQYQLKIDEAVNTFLAGVPKGLDDYGKTKYVYDYLIRTTEYVSNSENNQNIVSVFVNHKSVCLGYAKATLLLLRKLGINAAVVSGTVENSSHAWNIVLIDGEWYHLDTTWGDPNYLENGVPKAEDEMAYDPCYDTFLVSDSQIKKSHTFGNEEYYPRCVSTKNNYYRRENLYFTYYDEILMQQILENANINQQKKISVMCQDQSVFEEMKQKLIDEQVFFKLYPEKISKLRFSTNERMLTLTFCPMKE